MVVSASKTEEKLTNAPATMTVITATTIQHATSQNFAELLRPIPGLNITQVSARDINVTSRAATGTLATGLLALLDGRSLYQDMFGFVMWDFLPVNLNEIKQIEVIRGPASAVWGANALYGVVNVITKSPREMQGTSAMFGIGGFDRQQRQSGGLVVVHQRHPRAGRQRSLGLQAIGRRLLPGSAGPADRDRPVRPAGSLHRSDRDLSAVHEQRERPSRSSMHVSITTIPTAASYRSPAASPAPTASCTRASARSTSRAAPSWATVKAYTKKALRAAFFTNILHGDANNLLARNPSPASRSRSPSTREPTISTRRT